MMSDHTTIPSPLLLEQFRVHVWSDAAKAAQTLSGRAAYPFRGAAESRLVPPYNREWSTI